MYIRTPARPCRSLFFVLITIALLLCSCSPVTATDETFFTYAPGYSGVEIPLSVEEIDPKEDAWCHRPEGLRLTMDIPESYNFSRFSGGEYYFGKSAWATDVTVHINGKKVADRTSFLLMPTQHNNFKVSNDLLRHGKNEMVITKIDRTEREGWDVYDCLYVSTAADDLPFFGFVYFDYPPPEITDITITPEIRLTTQNITFTPVVTESPGWSIDSVTYTVTDKRSGFPEFLDFQDLLAPSEFYKPEPGRHGSKEVSCTITAIAGGTSRSATSAVTVPFDVYFEKGLFPYWKDDDLNELPNWFQYWRRDMAVPDIEKVQYDKTGVGYGQSTPDGEYIHPRAGLDLYPQPVVIPETKINPGGESFGGPGVTGIDSTAQVVGHELYHGWVRDQWGAGGFWQGLDNTDARSDVITYGGNNYTYNDDLPDYYEKFVSQTDWETNSDTYNIAALVDPRYQFYGDEEYMAMRAGSLKSGIVANDWSFPGKQSGSRPVTRALTNAAIPSAASGIGYGDLDAFPSTGNPAPAPADRGLDTNGDGLFDTLFGQREIEIEQEGLYEMGAVLYGNGGSVQVPMATARNNVHLGTGRNTVAINFSGQRISSAGINGPYTVTLSWSRDGSDPDQPPSPSWVTAPYASSAFKQLDAVFSGSWSGVPAEPDPVLNKYLQVTVPLDIRQPGTYSIDGYLQDPAGNTIAHAMHTENYGAGPAQAVMLFDGYAIRQARQNGNYHLVNFRITDAEGNTPAVVQDAFTIPLQYTDFGPSEGIILDQYSDAGSVYDDYRNLAPNGEFYSLRIESDFYAKRPGSFLVTGDLFDQNGTYVTSDSVRVSVGEPDSWQKAILSFPGKAIYHNGVNGTFTLRNHMIKWGSSQDFRGYAMTTSRSYQYTEFYRPFAVITGNVTDYGTDTDGDGLYDAITVACDVSTLGRSSTSGNHFSLQANLTTPEGVLISQGGGGASLSGDQQYRMTATFPAMDINGMGYNGPYIIRDLMVSDISNYDLYTKPVETGVYSPSQFKPAAILAGTVQSETGFPLAGVPVSADGKRTITDWDGKYRLFYPDARSMGVRVESPPNINMSQEYFITSVTPGSITQKDVVLFRRSSITGNVTADNGTPVTTGSVSVSGPTSESFNLASFGNGTYLISGIHNGTYSVSYSGAAGSAFVKNQTSGITLLPGQLRTFDILVYSSRTLTGRVTGEDGAPIRDARVVTIADSPAEAESTSSASGTFTLTKLIPGNYTLETWPPMGSGLSRNTTNVTITGEPVQALDIVLMPEAVAPQAWSPDCFPRDGNAPLAVSFTDQSKGFPTAWLWEFGDGKNSTEQNPSHTYTTGGSYNVTLTVSNAHGSDTEVFEDWISVYHPRLILPSGTLEKNTAGTFPLLADDIGASSVRLNLSYDPAVVRLDGIVDAADIVQNIETSIDNSAGEAAIEITFNGIQGFTHPTRLANLSFTTTGTEGGETALSAYPADQISCAGGEGCYPGAVEIPYNLSVTNGSIRITGGTGTLPVAAFTAAPTSGNPPLIVTFDSSPSNVLLPTAYQWTFGDGEISSLANPEHTYSAPGRFGVALTVNNLSGSNTVTVQDYIIVSAPPGEDAYVFVRKWGQEGSDPAGNGEFQYPTGVAVHPSGIVSVVDAFNSRVQVFAPDGKFLRMYRGNGTDEGVFSSPNSLAVDASGNTFVLDQTGTQIVNKFDPDGVFVTGWGTQGSGNGQFQFPNGIDVDTAGNIYVVDSSNNRVQKFGPDGTFIRTWGVIGGGNGEFLIPNGVAVDNAGNVYVADTGYQRVQKFDSDGTFITTWGTWGRGEGEFVGLSAIAVDTAGDIYIADTENHRIQKFSSDGSFITGWGEEGRGDGQFTYPYGIAVSTGGTVYVADSGNNRIQVFAHPSVSPLTAAFSENTTTGAVPLAVRFTDTSSGSLTGWIWSFGDGTTSTEPNPVHTYVSPGTYTVFLTVVGASGSDTVTKADLITVTPPASHEEYGPDGTDTGYDGNGDGIPDWQQENVASLHTTTGSYVTLAVPSPASLADVKAIENPSPSDAPLSAAFPAGFFAFTVTGIPAGSSTAVELHLPAGEGADTYYKYGPTPDNPAAHWYKFMYDGNTGAEINGRVVTLHYADGARGDGDLAADGSIHDPGAPALLSNQPPVLVPVGDQTIAEGSLWVISLAATDPDGDLLSYTSTGLPNGAVLTGRNVSWMPSFEQAGYYTITFTVTDTDGLSDAETITIQVTDTNRPPVLEPAENKAVAEGESMSFGVSASDPDGDAVTLAADPLPSGSSFTGGTFSWTPTYEQAGTYTITFIATDPSGLNSSRTVTITVTDVRLNDPPVISPIGDQEVAEGILLQFEITASDPDGDILNYAVVSPLPAGASFSGRTFAWTPASGQAGSYTVTFSATDPEGLPGTETISITVRNGNRAPVLAPIGDKTVEEGSKLSFTISAADPDGDALVFAAQDLPGGAVFDPASQEFRWTPLTSQAGIYLISFTATDSKGLLDNETISVTVSDLLINSPPVVSVPGERTVMEGELITFTVTATDPEGDPVTITAGPLPSGALFSAGTFSWLPANDQAGTYTLHFYAMDSAGLSGSATTTITVLDRIQNHPPVIVPVGDRSIPAGQETRFTISATDEDGDSLTYSAEPLPSGATFAGQEFAWTPLPAQAGIWEIALTVTDNAGLTDTEKVRLQVTVTENHPPDLTSLGNKAGVEGTLINFTVQATDPDGDVLTYGVQGLPPGSTFDAATREFRWIPSAGQAGAYPVTFTASDPGGLLDSETTTLTVTGTTSESWKVRIIPGVINLKSRGVFVAFITIPKPYNANELSAGSVTCEGATALRLIRHAKFPNTFGAVFRTSDLKGVKSGRDIPFLVRGIAQHNGMPVTFSGMDKVLVLNIKFNGKDDTEDITRMGDERIFEKLYPNT